jgi:hypothetical protein
LRSAIQRLTPQPEALLTRLPGPGGRFVARIDVDEEPIGPVVAPDGLFRRSDGRIEALPADTIRERALSTVTSDLQKIVTPPDLLALSHLDQKDRIQILLSEYSTLRSEILSRNTMGVQLTAIGVALITWLWKDLPKDPMWYHWIVIVLLAGVFVIFYNANVRDVKKAALRLRNLEHEINSRAGEHLLVWETLSGALTRGTGLFRSYFSKVEPLPRCKLPTLDTSYLVREARQTSGEWRSDG